jgi:phosphohistidine swiveling domain-containing protein
MNILRKAMAREVAELKPVLDRVYASIVRFQQNRTPANEERMREAMQPAIERLMDFRPLLPPYKGSVFHLLEDRWRELPAHDLIMLFDHCVSIMHVRLERKRSSWETQQPWTAELRRLLDSYRDAPAVGPVHGEFLCSGIAASSGRATGSARVMRDPDSLDLVQPGEILVCRFTLPDVVPFFCRIRALVTDEGGALSHAAIMAREAGVPAVTGCHNATQVICTGDAIQVDGDLGIVMTASAADVADSRRQ